jgi:hypothetical protein
LAFAFPGTSVPEIIIGLNKGLGEISLGSRGDKTVEPPEDARWLWFPPSSWTYAFDIQDFRNSSKLEIQKFLNYAFKKYSNPHIQNAVQNLLLASNSL